MAKKRGEFRPVRVVEIIWIVHVPMPFVIGLSCGNKPWHHARNILLHLCGVHGMISVTITTHPFTL